MIMAETAGDLNILFDVHIPKHFCHSVFSNKLLHYIMLLAPIQQKGLVGTNPHYGFTLLYMSGRI